MLALRPLSVAFLALCLAGPLRADEQTDSLAYEAKRMQVLERGPDEREGAILAAAQDLARDGYYAEALDLIFSMQDSAKADWEDAFDEALEAAAKAKPAPARAARPTGYVQSGIDFERWDDLDTTLSAHVRGKLEWDPPARAVDRLAAVAQGSDRNAYFDFTAKGAALRRLLRFESEALVEKLFWRAYGDSLDRLFLQAKLGPTTRPLGKPVAVEAPAYVETELYRHDRFGSPSHWAAGIAPGSTVTSKPRRSTWRARSSVAPPRARSNASSESSPGDHDNDVARSGEETLSTTVVAGPPFTSAWAL